MQNEKCKMKNVRSFAAALAVTLAALAPLATGDEGKSEATAAPGAIRCGNLVYGRGQTSKCFSHHFLADAEKMTNIRTEHAFTAVDAASSELFNFPFVVMSGEGAFTLTEPQRENLRQYLTNGGFLVASPGCSSNPWQSAFRREIAAVLPDVKLTEIPMTHPIFRTVYDIDELKTKHKGVKAHLEGLIVEGRIVCVYSPDGLNDTSNAGGNCCCCGGNEVLNARQVNVNLLGYALTH
ncbi:MAG: DUF4159 domain-containing protein [Phycisphaera sp.]|nr:DUF4159 domain-containing protein [Phycisphaera sp.]